MSEWTNEMSDKAIYALMERCGMLPNLLLKCELKKLENMICQAFKPTWGGPNDPDALKLKIEDLQLRLNAADQRIDELTADRGELIGYQYRMRPLWRKDDKAGWMDWRPCFADVAADFDANPEDKDWQYQTRALYAGPAPVAIAEQS